MVRDSIIPMFKAHGLCTPEIVVSAREPLVAAGSWPPPGTQAASDSKSVRVQSHGHGIRASSIPLRRPSTELLLVSEACGMSVYATPRDGGEQSEAGPCWRVHGPALRRV